jgi:retron-type reverse transcriptase
LASQIRNHIQASKLISDRQFGFRKQCSTDQIIFQLINKFQLDLQNKESKCITVAALDIKKAFDSVNHNLLLFKLNTMFSFNISSILLLQNYLTNRTQLLKCNELISTKRFVITGVPQGSVLGPLLFIMFINDITNLENCFLFADDCLISTTGSDPSHSSKIIEADLKNNMPNGMKTIYSF